LTGKRHYTRGWDRSIINFSIVGIEDLDSAPQQPITRAQGPDGSTDSVKEKVRFFANSSTGEPDGYREVLGDLAVTGPTLTDMNDYCAIVLA
jgi:hypothetical protein